MGTDGGLFETYDGTESWRFIGQPANHPILQGRS